MFTVKMALMESHARTRAKVGGAKDSEAFNEQAHSAAYVGNA